MLGLGNENSGWGLGRNKVEVQVRKLYCVSKAAILPINIEDAARSDVEIEKALQGIFRIQSQVGNIFRQFLIFEGFFEIRSPKLIAGSSEGGAAVFRLNHKGQDACLAQLPQLTSRWLYVVTSAVFFRMVMFLELRTPLPIGICVSSLALMLRWRSRGTTLR
ncbi:hypothetical protein C1H46_008414 [Malus baccata]|uniref:Aminoacyl-tRNA synthetase class II (D/K/N) domain-containing protein n=1 Tax=Malus baccata TaxID=106549 RepID=A0A540N669_MALBA|nr:hypothetical protein C1H46_008414 [Malus baccata]